MESSRNLLYFIHDDESSSRCNPYASNGLDGYEDSVYVVIKLKELFHSWFIVTVDICYVFVFLFPKCCMIQVLPTCLAPSNIKGFLSLLSFHFRSCLYIFLFITNWNLNISVAKIHFSMIKQVNYTLFDDNEC